MVALNSSLAEIDWQALFDHCNTENKTPLLIPTSSYKSVSVLHEGWQMLTEGGKVV